LSSVSTGDTVVLTDTTKFNPPDPYTGTRGWNQRLGVVLSSKLAFGTNPTVDIVVQLWPTTAYARIAPAALVVSKASDGLGAYFVIDIDGIVDVDGDIEDWNGFLAGDYIALYDATGIRKEAEVIAGFGDTKEADPDDADPANPRVYINGAIASAIQAGDYITFDSWDNAATNTANMDTYAAMCDADDELGGNNDPARVYI